MQKSTLIDELQSREIFTFKPQTQAATPLIIKSQSDFIAGRFYSDR
jgi:hypothetical protein